MPAHETFHTFDSVDAAISYRAYHGTGGWIAYNPDKGSGVLFPPRWTPTQIFDHPLTAWSNGCQLIGCDTSAARINRDD